MGGDPARLGASRTPAEFLMNEVCGGDDSQRSWAIKPKTVFVGGSFSPWDDLDHDHLVEG
jgi:hypothetical protein